METYKEQLSENNVSTATDLYKHSLTWHDSFRVIFRQWLIKLSRILPKTQQIFYLGYENDDF